MVTYDPIFEEHYRAKVDAMIQNAFFAGKNQGTNEVLSIVYQLSEDRKKLVSFDMVIETLKASIAAQSTQAEILNNDAVPKPAAPQPIEKKKPVFEVVK
jgi:hypothetical protein